MTSEMAGQEPTYALKYPWRGAFGAVMKMGNFSELMQSQENWQIYYARFKAIESATSAQDMGSELGKFTEFDRNYLNSKLLDVLYSMDDLLLKVVFRVFPVKRSVMLKLLKQGCTIPALKISWGGFFEDFTSLEGWEDLLMKRKDLLTSYCKLLDFEDAKTRDERKSIIQSFSPDTVLYLCSPVLKSMIDVIKQAELHDTIFDRLQTLPVFRLQTVPNNITSLPAVPNTLRALYEPTFSRF